MTGRSPASILFDSLGNAVGVTLDGAIYRLQVDAKLTAGGAAQIVKIEDGSGSGRLAVVDNANRVLVATQPPAPPPGTTAVHQVAQGNVNGNNTSDLTYLIPNTKTITITRFAGGSEGGNNKNSKVELYHDPLGTGVGMTLIRVGYVSGSNFESTLDQSFVGDGAMKVRMRRERMNGGTREVFGAWDGFVTV